MLALKLIMKFNKQQELLINQIYFFSIGKVDNQFTQTVGY